MKVKAIKQCFIGGRVQQPGDIFEFPGSEFPKHLVTPVPDELPVTKPKAKPQDSFPPSGGVREPKVISDDARDVDGLDEEPAPKAKAAAKTAVKASKATKTKPAAKSAAKSKAK